MHKKFTMKHRLATLITSTALPAVLFASTVMASSPSHAAECSPLSIVSVKPIDARPIIENGYSRGVSFRILATVKNTNPSRSYRPHRDNAASLQVISTGKVEYQSPRHNSVPMNRTLRGNETRVVSSARIKTYKKLGQHNLQVTLQGLVTNFQCKSTYRAFIGINYSKYDLTPVIQDRTARRLSARITGPSEATRPRPRPASGTGAPRPRT